MGLVSDAAAMARGRAGAIFLTAALALLPAYFLAGGIVFLAAAQASAQAEGGSTQADAAAARGRELPPDAPAEARRDVLRERSEDTRLNSSHSSISYAVFCLKK